MTPQTTAATPFSTCAKLRRSLIAHEGFKPFGYVDTVGKITLGIGFNVSDRGMDHEWINNQYDKDVNYFYTQLSTFCWFKDVNTDRKIVLVDMCFMGFKRFVSFTKMIEALSIHDYDSAADEMLNSEWAEEVKGRAKTLAFAMRSGEYNI